MFNYHHSTCDTVVFTYPTELKNGDAVEAHLALVDGRRPFKGQTLVCMKCEQLLQFNHMDLVATPS